MADQDPNQIASVSVGVQADLGQYRADLTAARGDAEQFDKAATAAMGGTARATQSLTAAQRQMVEQVRAGTVTLDQLRASLGTTAAAEESLRRVTDALASSQRAEAASSNVASDAARRLADSANVAATGHAAAGKAAISARAAYEPLVIVHELLQGRTSRLTGSLLIEGQALLGAERTAKLLSAAMTPMGLAVAAAAAAFAFGTYSALQYEAAQRQLLITSLGLGSASGHTKDELADLAVKGFGSTSIGAKDAYTAVNAYAAAGVRTGSTIRALKDTTEDFAILTGQKTSKAVEELAAAMEHPTEGAKKLNEQLHFLGSAELQEIETLDRLGDKTGAQDELTQALARHNREAAEAAGGLRSAWQEAGDAFSNTSNFVGKTIDQMTQLLSLALQLDNVGGRGAGAAGARASARDAAQREFLNHSDLQRKSAEGFELFGSTPEGQFAARKADLDKGVLKSQAELDADKKLYGEHSDAVARDRKQLEDYAHALLTLETPVQKKLKADALDVQIAKARHEHNQKLIQDLTTQKAQIEQGGVIESFADARALAAGAGSVAGARGGARARKDTFGNQDASVQVDAAEQLKLADAYLQSDGAALRAEASRKALTEATRAGRTEAQKLRLVQDEINLSVATAVAGQAKEVSALEAQTAAARRANDAVASGELTRKEADRQEREELRMRPLLAAAQEADGAVKVKLTAILNRLTQAQHDYNAEADRQAAVDDRDRNKDEIELLQLRTRLVGKPRSEQEPAIARLQEEQRLGPKAAATPEGQAAIGSAGDRATAQSQLEGANAYRQMTEQVEKETLALQKQSATVGMTLQQADRYLKMEELLLEAKRDGVTVDDAERQRLQGLADGYARAAQSARDYAQTQKAAQEAAKTFTDETERGLEGILFDGKKVSDVARDVARNLGRDALRATLSGEGPLAGLLGTANGQTVGGANGGILSQVFGKVFGVGQSGQKGPTGAPGDPIYVTSDSAAGGAGGGLGGLFSGLFGGSGGSGGGGGIGGFFSSLFGGGSSGAAVPADLAGLYHTGTSSVGSGPPPATRLVPSSLFVGAPRLHSGLAPDEFPAILQHGEGVTRRGTYGRSTRQGDVHMHIHGVGDQHSFMRTRAQTERSLKRAMAKA